MRALVLLLSLLLAAPAFAQPADRECHPGEDAAARKLLRLTLHQPQAVRTITATAAADPAPQADKPPDALAEPARIASRRTVRDERAGLSGESIRILVTLEGSDPQTWNNIRLRGAARTVGQVDTAPSAPGRDTAVAGGNDLCLYRFAGVYARLHSHDGRTAAIEVNYPDRVSLALREHWSLVVALHHADSDLLFAYATLDVRVGSLAWSGFVSVALTMLIYALVMLVALQASAGRLERAADARMIPPEERAGWRWRMALNPILLTQDASGIGSLARLQLLAFTLAVTFVYAYVFVRTGELAALSPDVLKLLGITVVGSALARIAGESGSVTPANRIWLKGKALIRSDDARLAKASDLVCADGEVEIARVQAIIFSALTIVALLATGPRDLGGFQLSNEMLYLLGLSQLAYVAGKAIPAEGVRRLNQEVAALRAAERQLSIAQAKLGAARAAGKADELPRLSEEASAAGSAWNAALAAAEDTLADVYGTTLDADGLRAMRV